jgi:DNA-binding NtrC family response regulator
MDPHHEDDRPSNRTLEIARSAEECAFLLEIQDEDGVRIFPLPRRKLSVGSGKEADFPVRDATVSARHCTLDVLGHGVSVEDQGSRNGTFVGSAKVGQAWASAGTTVTIGRTTLVFVEAPADPHDMAADVAPLEGIVGGSAPMRRVAEQVRRLARHAAPVLVAGETGTGKELVARALHSEGPRAKGPFIAINVSALPRELVESEMFGHERGAFTGAVTRRAGAFVEAQGGTLFLDEIGELPLDAQPKMLRALDGYEVRRVGAAGGGAKHDARVVVATHVPLEEHVLDGRFRRDLFHRLEVFVVEVPPLRARRGDIAAISRELLRQMTATIGKRELSSAALARLSSHDWPGNVRELRNVLFRAADLSVTTQLDAPIIERAMRVKKAGERTLDLTPSLAKAWLAQHGGNMTAAARAAGYPRTTFRKLLPPGSGV